MTFNFNLQNLYRSRLWMVFCFCLTKFDYTDQSESWNYGNDGPDVWVHEYPQCAGILQSPINIDTSQAIYSNKLADIKFNNYDAVILWNATNNGHTIVVNQIDEKQVRPYITGSNFNPEELFFLTQFHFHWGQNIYQGSEHHIDDVKFPLEVHLVHQSYSGTIAVVAFVFEIDEKNNTALNYLLTLVGEDIADYTFNTSTMALSSILPNFAEANKNGYYRYIGSLTTPPCSEGVIWTVYKTRGKISASQMKNFYENEIHYNFRDVQTLHKRALLTSVGSNVESFYRSTTKTIKILIVFLLIYIFSMRYYFN